MRIPQIQVGNLVCSRYRMNDFDARQGKKVHSIVIEMSVVGRLLGGGLDTKS